MTERPEPDEFSRNMEKALTGAELRQQMHDTIAPVAEQVIANAVRPWRRLVFWLTIGYGVLIVASVVQAVL